MAFDANGVEIDRKPLAGAVDLHDHEEVLRVLAGVLASLLGLLALAFSWWFPTATLLFGPLAVVTGLIGRRRLATVGAETTPGWAERLNGLGVAMGIAAVVATVIFVIVTTE